MLTYYLEYANTNFSSEQIRNIVTTNNAATLTVAKNQSSAGTITMGAGDLNLTVGNNVNNLNFADCSGGPWGANLVITGFTSGVLGFGNNANGLTNAQLAKVNIGGATCHCLQ